MYPLAYERCLRNVIASEGRRTSALSRGWATWPRTPAAADAAQPLERGLAAFMLATLAAATRIDS